MVEAADPLNQLYLDDQIQEKKDKIKQLELYIKTFKEQTGQIESDLESGMTEINKKLAIPLAAVEEANAACKNVQKDLQMYFSVRNPPSEVLKVLQAVMTLFGYKTDWFNCTKIIQSYSFKSDILNFGKDNVSEKTLEKVQVFIDDLEFQPDKIRETSEAVANLACWVKAIYQYSVVFQTVKQKKKDLDSQKKESDKIMEAL